MSCFTVHFYCQKFYYIAIDIINYEYWDKSKPHLHCTTQHCLLKESLMISLFLSKVERYSPAAFGSAADFMR